MGGYGGYGMGGYGGYGGGVSNSCAIVMFLSSWLFLFLLSYIFTHSLLQYGGYGGGVSSPRACQKLVPRQFAVCVFHIDVLCLLTIVVFHLFYFYSTVVTDAATVSKVDCKVCTTYKMTIVFLI